MENLKENWNNVLKSLQSSVSSVSYELFLKELEALDVDENNTLFIVAPSEAVKSRVYALQSSNIKMAIQEVLPEIKNFEILSPEEKEEYLIKNPEAKAKQEEEIDESKYNWKCKFNPKYTFDSFVIGDSNMIVHAAMRSVAENPGQKINPLFIYGGVGLGKTHLMHAVGNFIHKTKPTLDVYYCTCEQFTNDYIQSLNSKERGIAQFREKYRNLDVLMIDDIQFISGKTETQGEFFHTFNDLYQNNKQIIIASDRPPKEIATLSDRLISRFSSGLIQDIGQPDFETKVAILRKKATLEGYNIDDDVIDFIASNVDSNVRELEGTLSKVCFLSNLMGKKFADLNDAKLAIKHENKVDEESLTGEKILDTVAKYYKVSKDDILGKKKNKEIVIPRQVCIYLLTEMLSLSLESIGQFIGRDHTTVIHARDKIADTLKTSQKLQIEVSDLKSMIKR